MTTADIIFQRLHNEHLVGEPFEKAEDVVKWFGAVQSQDFAGAKWAIAKRTKGGVTTEKLDALYNAGKILRTHVLRPTWHFVDPSDIRWLLALTAPRVKRLLSYYDAKLSVDEALLKKSFSLITKALRNNNFLTRTELADRLKNGGITAKGQTLAHIVMHAELAGVICSGPLRKKQFTYALLEERVLKAKHMTRDEALGELTRRYFMSHGPALVQDCAWWSGLTVADIQKGIAISNATLASEVINGKTYWFTKSSNVTSFRSPLVHLLPNYDEYLISYKDYSPVQDSSLMTKYADTSMFLGHLVVLDGLVLGGWRRTFEKKSAVVTVKNLRPLTTKENEALQKEVKKFGKFLGMPVILRG